MQVETQPPSEYVRSIHRQYLANTDLTAASWAASAYAGCSGAFIGPNIWMTAAHCALASPSLTFTLPNPFGEANNGRLLVRRSTWPVACTYLLQAFSPPGSDVAFYYCPPDPNTNLDPGDVYGYLDVDGQTDVAVNEDLVAFFTSSSDQLGTFTGIPGQIAQTGGVLTITGVPGGTMQYGRGAIFSKSCLGGQGNSVGLPGVVGIRGRAEGGNSGGVYVSPTTYRIRVGPQSVGVGGLDSSFTCNSPSGPIPWQNEPEVRYARSAHLYYYLTETDPAVEVNTSGIASLVRRNMTPMGITPPSCSGSGCRVYIDDDLNYHFDIQEQIELAMGESPRPWQFYGFQSRRQDLRWFRASSMAIASTYGTGNASINRTSTGYQNILRLNGLNLEPGATYRLSIMVNASSSTSNALSYGLCSMVGGNCVYSGNQFLPQGAERLVTSRAVIPSNATSVRFDVDAHSSVSGWVDSIGIVREGAVMDFDTHDARQGWRNEITGGGAKIIPLGRTSAPAVNVLYPVPNQNLSSTIIASSAVDWALYVEENQGQPSGYPARNSQLALVNNRIYQMCLWHRRRVVPSSDATANARVRVVSFTGSSWVESLVTQTFLPGTSWQDACFTFQTLSGQSVLQFGTSPGTDPLEAAYLIDDISINDVTP